MHAEPLNPNDHDWIALLRDQAKKQQDWVLWSRLHNVISTLEPEPLPKRKVRLITSLRPRIID